MARRSSPRRTGFGELKAAAVAGDADTFVRWLRELFAEDAARCVEKVRQDELLFVCRSRTGRADIRRAYLNTVLQVRAGENLLHQQAVYVSYCEVVAEIRDELAAHASEAAASLRQLGHIDAVEACTRIAASRIRRFLASAARTHHAHPKRSSLKTAATLSDVSHEIGGLHSLLPHMIKELFCDQGDATPESSRNAPRGCTPVAARHLFRVAEDWQTLSYLRQRVAFGEVTVERVEQGDGGAHLYLVPRHVHEAWRRPAAERRLANMRTQRRLSEPALASFPIDIQRLVEGVAQALPVARDATAASAATVVELKNEIAASIRAVDIVLIRQAHAAAAATTLALWAAQLTAIAIDAFARFALRADAMYGRPWRFTLLFAKATLRQIVAESAGVGESVAEEYPFGLPRS